MRRKPGLLLLGLLLAGFVAAEETEPAKPAPPVRSPEALEILKKVDAATKAVDSVRCHVTSQVTGVAKNFVSDADGDSVMVGWNGTMPEKFYAHVKTKNRKGEPVELSGGGNGETYFLIDHTTKKAYQDMDPGVMGSGGRTLQGAGMMEFVHDHPFDDELNAEGLALEPEEAVDGEPCYRIHVEYAGGQGQSTWFFSKKDFLPRRRIRKFTIPGQGDGAVETTVSRLETNIKPEESLFRMKLPEGYQAIDDFAP